MFATVVLTDIHSPTTKTQRLANRWSSSSARTSSPRMSIVPGHLRFSFASVAALSC